MRIHYLEIVTPNVDGSVDTYSKLYGVTFSAPDPNLGGARTATLSNSDGTDSGLLGIRAPMHDAERAVVRPYVLVDDIDAVVKEAKKAGVEIAVPPMEIPGRGKCAIFIQDGVESGLWQL